MDQNNQNPQIAGQAIIPPVEPKNPIPKGASFDSINPATGSTPTAVPIPKPSTPDSNFKAGQADWSKFNPEEPAKLPKDNESADVYKYLDPKTYSNLPGTPVPAKVPSYLNPGTENKVKTVIHTYKSDAEEAVKFNHASSIDIALAEQKRKQMNEGKMEASTGADIKSFKLIIYIVLGFLFLSAGGYTLYYLAQSSLAQKTNPDINNNIATPTGYNLIYTDRKEEKKLESIDASKLSVVLRNFIETTSLPNGNLEEVLITQNPTGKSSSVIKASDFFRLNSITLPDDLSRDILNSFTFGIYNKDGNQPFLIFKTNTMQTSYPGMWSWQKGTLVQDIKNVFPLNTGKLRALASGTPQQISYRPFFADTIINNTDSFILRDVYNRPFLVYTIFDKTTIIVSTTPETISAILTRLISAKNQQR